MHATPGPTAARSTRHEHGPGPEDGDPGPYVLYAIAASLYSGKARSYLRKRHIDFVERVPAHPRFGEEVVPRIGRVIVPVLECPDGELVQDTADIIDHFEAGVDPALSIYPATPIQLVVARTLEMFGGEGLMRPAMHYRWSFDEENLEFVRGEFIRGLAPGADPEVAEQVFAWASGAFRQATVDVGATAETIPEIERSYEEFLDLFSAHLETTPYLLGGRPTIADFGFIAPLHAHLSRDPYPSVLMKQRAPLVWRWVERMTSPAIDAGEYPGCVEELFPEDEIPATLKALLRYAGEDYLPEVKASVGFLDGWLEANGDVSEGDVIPYTLEDRWLGRVTFGWRGNELTVGVLPYRLLPLQRIQHAFGVASPPDQARVRELFSELGLEALLDLRPRRRVERRDNREVWGASQEPSLA